MNKTKPTNQSVEEYLNQVHPEQKRKDCFQLKSLMEKISGCPAVMWGNMVGFGDYHYVYDSGREGDFFLIGFAARSKNISIYGAAYNDEIEAKKAKLGKVKLGKSCIYINKLEDVNLNPNYALGDLLQGQIASIMGTSNDFCSHRDGHHDSEQKSSWSTHYYCTSAFLNENPTHNAG